jgi:hypothetical protein
VLVSPAVPRERTLQEPRLLHLIAQPAEPELPTSLASRLQAVQSRAQLLNLLPELLLELRLEFEAPQKTNQIHRLRLAEAGSAEESRPLASELPGSLKLELLQSSPQAAHWQAPPAVMLPAVVPQDSKLSA